MKCLTKAGCLFLLICATQSILYRAHADQKSNPIALATKAEELFPKKLAGAVQEEITRIVISNPQGNQESLATLFLADRFYSKLKTGHFEGAPMVVWDAYSDQSERPTFWYPGSNFAYVTSDGRRITPSAMDTNGGSIPQVLHAVNRYSPWTYGPAFIIHDWIFVAHKCGTEPDSNISFNESAMIMAEAIKTLMEVGFKNRDGETKKFTKNEDTLYFMYLAVISSISKKVWSDTDSVKCR